MHGISKYTLNGIFSMILNFNKPTIVMKPKKITTFLHPFKKRKMLRDTPVACWIPLAYACHGSIAPRPACTCWFVMGQWLHVEPTCIPWFLHCGLHCCFRKLFATYTWHCQTWCSICFDWYLVNKYTGIWSTSVQCVITGGCEGCASVLENGLTIWCD